MYLLKDEAVTLNGLRKGHDTSEASSYAPRGKEDVEASAATMDGSRAGGH